jgi:hypothetical protein
MKRSDIIRRLDHVFADYIKARDVTDGKYRCISCFKAVSRSQIQCGHYIPRKHLATRWDELNAHCQCIDCNCFKDGNLIEYRKNLIKKIGRLNVERLEASRFSFVKVSDVELLEKLEYYRKLLKDAV